MKLIIVNLMALTVYFVVYEWWLIYHTKVLLWHYNTDEYITPYPHHRVVTCTLTNMTYTNFDWLSLKTEWPGLVGGFRWLSCPSLESSKMIRFMMERKEIINFKDGISVLFFIFTSTFLLFFMNEKKWEIWQTEFFKQICLRRNLKSCI